jgi:hypothetical protein
VSGSTSVDINTIPVELIERVEVITGGASAVYGADAVAGVVNFIMKKKFDGYELRGQTGDASEGDFSRSFFSFTGGNEFAGGRGSVVYSAEYSKQDNFGRGDRAIGRRNLISMPNPAYDRSRPSTQDNPQRVFMGPGGNSSISYGGTFDAGGKRYQFDDNGTFRPTRYDGPRDGANTCVNCDFVDLNNVADLQPAFDRYSVNALVNFDINENHKFFFEGKYTRTESQFNAQPAFDQPLRIRRDNAYLSPQLAALMDANGLRDPNDAASTPAVAAKTSSAPPSATSPAWKASSTRTGATRSRPTTARPRSTASTSTTASTSAGRPAWTRCATPAATSSAASRSIPTRSTPTPGSATTRSRARAACRSRCSATARSIRARPTGSTTTPATAPS